MLSNLKAKKWTIPAIHFLAWLLFFSVPFFFVGAHPAMPPDFRTDFRQPPLMDRTAILFLSLFTNLLLVVIFYLNIAFIAPLFTKRGKYGFYLGIQLGVLLVFYLIVHSIFQLLAFPEMPRPVGFQLFSYVIIVLGSLCYSLIKKQMEHERLQKEIDTERLQSELTFLRWQISPHFFFNVLNGMVALARNRSQKLEVMLMDLSNLMRYMLYETGDRLITIEREIEYLRSYIELQNMRFGADVKVTFDAVISEDTNEQDLIESMLFIPLIENAYKHGIGGIADPEIIIRISFFKNAFALSVRNKYKPREVIRDAGHEVKGIGLTNVKRRLNLLYPNKHSLTFGTSNGWHSSKLTIIVS